MRYPPDMTVQDIMEFEYDFNRLIDIDRGVGPYWEVNAECQIVAEQQHKSI